MKIRNGFVSNSSSSSFIVSFPKEPKSAEDVKEMLFGDEKYYYGYYSDDFWTAEQVSETVWKDICDQNKNDYDELISQLKSVSSYDDPDAPSYDSFNHISDYQRQWELLDEASERYAKKKVKEFINIRKNKLKKLNNEYFDDAHVYVFHYADDEGSYSAAMEHGDLFKNLKHLRINRH
jgi:hypothetical protein